MKHHGRRLQEDRDYVLLEAGALTQVPTGGVRYTKKVWQVYLIADDGEAFMCPDCREVTAETVRGITGHLNAHGAYRKAAPKSAKSTMRRDAAAFRLLPARVQRAALRKLSEQGKAGESGGETDAELR